MTLYESFLLAAKIVAYPLSTAAIICIPIITALIVIDSLVSAAHSKRFRTPKIIFVIIASFAMLIVLVWGASHIPDWYMFLDKSLSPKKPAQVLVELEKI